MENFQTKYIDSETVLGRSVGRPVADMVYWYQYRPDLWKRVEVRGKRIDGRQNDSCWEDTEQHDPALEKLSGNVRRAVARIEAVALCNQWDFFVTFTLDRRKYDRSDLDDFRADLTQFFRDQRKKWGCDLRFLVVPELHADGQSWHMHGLLSGLSDNMLVPFSAVQHLPYYILDRIAEGALIYGWPDYAEKFGHIIVEPVRNGDAVARYLMKYLKKGLQGTAKKIQVNKHLYFCSRGLERPGKILKSNASDLLPDALPVGLVPDGGYVYDMGSVQWYKAAGPCM